jgi:PAT family beta-lactamase induction signal transducer AmpG
VGHGEIGGYALFFLGTALTGIPALLLCLLLARRMRSEAAPDLPARGPPG